MQEYDRPNSAYMLFYERPGGAPALPEPPSAADQQAIAAAVAAPETPAAPPAAALDSLPAAPADTEMTVSPMISPQLRDTAAAAAVTAADAAAGSPHPMASNGGGGDAAAAAAQFGDTAAAGRTAAATAAVAAASEASASASKRPCGMPASVFEAVMKDNLQVLQEKHTLTKPYFRCAFADYLQTHSLT